MTAPSTRRQFLFTTGALAGIGAASLPLPAFAEGAPSPKAEPGSANGEGKKLGWAIVGLGSLALGEILPAFKDCANSKPVALVSGHADKAAKVAAEYGIASDAIYNYENFEKIADDPRIDVVYIVLPNSMHAEYTIRALKAGKHVFCEKPMAVKAEEGTRMAEAARTAGKKLGIAYRLHYEPLTRQAREWCRSQRFGQIRAFSASNCQNVGAPNIRLNTATGGGPLGDIGIYEINAARYMLDEEPIEVSAYAYQPSDDPRFKEVPATVVFSLRYPSGVLATCVCSFASTEDRSFTVNCAKGRVHMENAFAYKGLKLEARDQMGEVAPPGGQAAINQFTAEMDAFSQAVSSNGEVRTPAELGIADMKIIEALYESAAKGAPVKVSI